jgi:hypothetical protein
MKNETTVRTLLCEISHQEFIEFSEELARNLTKLSEFEVEKARISEKMKTPKLRVQELVPIVDSKQMKKPVDCIWTIDWENGQRFLIRVDTGEELENDIIPEHMKQSRLI